MKCGFWGQKLDDPKAFVSHEAHILHLAIFGEDVLQAIIRQWPSEVCVQPAVLQRQTRLAIPADLGPCITDNRPSHTI